MTPIVPTTDLMARMDLSSPQSSVTYQAIVVAYVKDGFSFIKDDL